MSNTIDSLGRPKNITTDKKAHSNNESPFFEGIKWSLLSIPMHIIPSFIVAVIIIFLVALFNFELGEYVIAITGFVMIINMIRMFFKGYNECTAYQLKEQNEYLELQNMIREDEERVAYEKSLIPTYRQNQNLFSNNISDCQNALEQLYNLDIIFPKYRNFVAISQIYEYYMSGRCTELEGHEGAYNIFENEVRQDIIILQLNNISNQLEQIKQNQYLIYQAITQTNITLSKIESNTEAIAYNTSVIAANTAICARYTEIGGSKIY